MLRRERGSPVSYGSSHARAFTATTTEGGKLAGPTATGQLFEPGQALVEEAFAPLADDLPRGVEPLADLLVGESFSRIENDLGSDDINIR